MFVIHAELVELFTLIQDAILLQGLVHVQVPSIIFPGIASRMGVVL